MLNVKCSQTITFKNSGFLQQESMKNTFDEIN